MTKLKVAKIGATLSERVPDRRHLTRSILESDAHDGQFGSKGSPQVASLHERRVEICIGVRECSETGPKRFDGAHHL